MELDRKPVSPTESTGKELQLVTLWSCLFEIVVGQNAEHSVMCKRGQFANAGGTADMRIRPGM